MLELGLKSLLSYLLGSLIGALIVGRFKGGVDIRTEGSGNAGGTNALRTRGKAFAFWVMLIDIGKGVLAAAWLPGVDIPGVGIDPQLNRDWLTMACAGAVIVGHVYPLWYGFRGGKGAATLIGVLLGLQPWLLVPVLLVWFIAVTLLGYVGLATILASIALPLYVAIAQTPAPVPLLTFGVLMAAFILFTHRGNVARMVRGEENRARSLWLLRR